jgi:hypothetical protein
MMTFEDFTGVLVKSPREGGAVAHVIAAVKKERGVDGFEDDVSMVEVVL